MRKIIFILFVTFCIDSFAQNYNDSILILLNQPVDSNKLHRLLNYNLKILYDQPKEAITNFEKFEKIAKEIDCKTCLIWALKDKSISLKNIGNYNASLEALFKALSLTTGETKTKSGILNNIAIVYNETKDYNKAIIYLKNAVLINEKKQYLTYLGINYNNLGITYKNLGDSAKASFFYNQAIDLRLKLGKNEDLAQSYLNLADMYNDLKKSDKALFYAYQALQICDSIKSDFGLTFVYNCLGSIYLQKNDLQKAKLYCLKSYELSKKVNNTETLLNSALLLYKINKGLSDLPKAMVFQEEYYNIKDSIYNIETTKKQLTLEYQNELNIKNAEQEKKDLLAKQEREKENVIKNIFTGGFAIMLFLSLIILNGYRNKRKANGIIAAQKEETERQKMLLEVKQKEIIDSIHYAKRIQGSLLPTEKYIDKSLNRLKNDIN